MTRKDYAVGAFNADGVLYVVYPRRLTLDETKEAVMRMNARAIAECVTHTTYKVVEISYTVIPHLESK